MRRIRRGAALVLLGLASAGLIWAEEGFGFGAEEGDGFSEGFGGGFDSGNSGSEDGFGGGFGGGFGDFGGAGEGSSPLSWGGEISLPVRGTVAAPEDDQALEATPEGRLELGYETEKAGATLDFSVLKDKVELNELSLRYYGSPFLVEAGYMKRVWGKGDEYHVINLMNPRNLEDFTNGGEYIKWIDPEIMLSVSMPVRQMGQLELLYAPRFTGDVIPSSGRWSPYQADKIAALATSAVKYQALAAYNAVIAADPTNHAAASLAQTRYLQEHGSADALYPDTKAWDWSQFGVYYTDTFGSVDLGLMYYYGYYGEPAVDASFSGAQITALSLDYNRMQAFGIDFGAVVGPFNTRGELAYYLTEDVDGDDPKVYNNRLKWVGGFDVNLPFSALNINIQEAGTYIVNNDKIKAGDMEHDGDGDYTENLIILKLSDKYNHEKVEAAVTCIWHIEKQGWKIAPSLTVDLSDNLEFRGEYVCFGGDGDESLFGQFDKNDYAELKLSYSF